MYGVQIKNIDKHGNKENDEKPDDDYCQHMKNPVPNGKGDEDGQQVAKSPKRKDGAPLSLNGV